METEHRISTEKGAVIGQNMREIRLKAGRTQKEVADALHVERSLYTKYETGKSRPCLEFVRSFADCFHVSQEELEKAISAVIPDTSALLQNPRLMSMLLEDYDQVFLPEIVLDELDRHKDHGVNHKEAWQVMTTICEYQTRYRERVQVLACHRSHGQSPDEAIIEAAQKLKKQQKGRVDIIHNDVGFSLRYQNNIQLKTYIAHRRGYEDYESVSMVDLEYDNLTGFRNLTLNYNTHLLDGSTILIHTIRCNVPSEVRRRGTRIPDEKILAKLKFLLDHGANPDQTNYGAYCLTPLGHCAQVGNYAAFDLLLRRGADYNKGSVDELSPGALKRQEVNEGNTPLMIACWHGRKSFVKRLFEFPDLSVNQQDSNGYTALIKCAVQRQMRKKRNRPCGAQEHLYHWLLEHGADPRIRDRNNRTAADWWELGDRQEEEGRHD